MQIADKDTEIIKKLHSYLLGCGKKVSTVESCTGGLLAWMLTFLPGSSAYYKGGISAYSNDVKSNIVGVKEKTLQMYGAVSAETAIELAHGVMIKLGTDCAVSLTGVAGPDGGSEEKPVGTVWCGIAFPNGTQAYLFQLHGDRNQIRQQAAILALEKLYELIKGLK